MLKREEKLTVLWVEIEYFLNGKGDMDLDYIKALEKGMIDAGVKVPLSFNDVSLLLKPLSHRVTHQVDHTVALGCRSG
jgi:hypothetical protein